ncbi:MAG TPA: phosphoenolpyruvate--protein phosphotransferase [Smithellaceae bacterium]|nr:phosphoenolpyruvate--protein phosphotransferase [Smithellaceae bacterium]
MEHINLLLDIGELNWVFKDSADTEALLQNVVKMVARHMQADVCSIYFFDEKNQELVLRANVGLKKNSIGKIKMKLGEGIAGSCLERLEHVCTEDSLAHPDFKYFPGINEELYKSFLAEPIVSKDSRVGVIVLQRKEDNPFKENDAQALRIISSQLATLIENAKLMTSMNQYIKKIKAAEWKPQLEAKFIKGKSASRGYAYARIAVIEDGNAFEDVEKMSFAQHSPADFYRAVKETEKQIELLQRKVEKNLTDAASMIFTSHLMILKDKTFINGIIEQINKGKNPPEAVISVTKKYIHIFLASPNEYIREKSKDIEDLAVRIIANIVRNEMELPGVKGRIVIAREMYPSDVLRLSSEQIKGAILISGGVTSHVSILAGTLGIPMVIVNEPTLLNVNRKAKILLDAVIGNIYINPPPDILDEFSDRLERKAKEAPAAMTPITKTRDGLKIQLMANVNLLKDLETLKELVCDGIGLYRSEFPFIIRSNYPTEEEQYFVYRKLAEGMPGKEITFRTLDVGGDKILSYSRKTKIDNPVLGLRSIRFSLKNREIFAEQIRAILRAGYEADLRIMFPMIYSLEEFLTAKEIVRQCAADLKEKGIRHNGAPQTGMMVEIPAAVEIISEFAGIADFFSIGTNDLIQYMLAVDRSNEEVAEYYLPHHPAILRAVKKIAAAAQTAKIDISVCGDMANSAAYIKFLIGAGITKLSMNPEYLGENQKIIAALDAKECRQLAEEIVGLSRVEDIEKMLWPEKYS